MRLPGGLIPHAAGLPGAAPVAGRRLFAALILAVLAAVPAGVPAPALAQTPAEYQDQIESNRRRLDELKRQATAKREKARKYAREEQGVLARLNKAEQAIAATRDYLRSLEQRQSDLEREIARTEADLREAHAALGDRREVLAERLRYSYMHGKARSLEIVFAADSFPDLLQRSAFLKRVLQQDRRLILEVEEREAGIQDDLSRLRGQREEMERVIGEKQSERKQCEALKRERSRELTQVRDQRAQNEQAAKELEQAAARMEQLLAELDRKRQEAMRRHSPVLAELDRNDFGKNRGKLPWPADGEILSEFGRHEHPKYKTVTLNNGVDIGARLGSPVRSVADGVVDMIQWLPGYGQTIIVNHGRGFYTIYAHLASVSVSEGSRVDPGQTVGAVGDTGSLKGACLHFEVRFQGEAQDPLGWLR